MILACPLCHTRYLVAATLFGTGPRQVRCARCQHGWLANQQGNAEDIKTDRKAGTETQPIVAKPTYVLDLPPLLLETVPSLRAAARRATEFMWRWRSYVAIACAAILLAWLIFDRQDIAQNRPFLKNIYETTGLRIYHFHGEGLGLVQVRSELRFESGLMKLWVEGKIQNKTKYTQEIPDILASAIGPDGQTLQSWQIDAPAHRVLPGENVPFHSSINAPKGTVVDLNLSFIEIKDIHDRDH